MKAVLDTNVLLSATFTPGVCEVLLDLCLTLDDVTIVLCEHILSEFVHHGVAKFQAPADKVQSVAEALRQRCTMVEPAPVPTDAFDDPDDLPVLGAAVAGEVDCLVTGDQGLLRLREYERVAIVSPRAFYDRLRG